MKKTILFATFIAGTSLLFNSCKKEDDNGGNGNIAIKMTDSPGPYQKVSVDIQQVSVHLVPSGAGAPAQWINLPTNAGVYDLLLLQNGIDTSIVKSSPLPAGKITEMRLILGTNNSVMVNNATFPMTVPSGTNTGIKIPGPITVAPNITLQVKLDFVASQSVVDNGNQEYHLKPVIQSL